MAATFSAGFSASFRHTIDSMNGRQRPKSDMVKIALRAFLVSLTIFYAGKGVRLLKRQHINVADNPVVVEKSGVVLVAEEEEIIQSVTSVTQPIDYSKPGPSLIVERPLVVEQEKAILVEQEQTVHTVASVAKPVDYSKPKGNAEPKDSLKWLTTQFKANHFDTSDQLYVRDAEVTIQFDRLDHRKLFAGYKSAMGKLQEVPPQQKALPPPLSLPLMANKVDGQPESKISLPSRDYRKLFEGNRKTTSQLAQGPQFLPLPGSEPLPPFSLPEAKPLPGPSASWQLQFGGQEPVAPPEIAAIVLKGDNPEQFSFDISHDSYAPNSAQVDIQFEGVNHSKLLNDYSRAVAQLPPSPAPKVKGESRQNKTESKVNSQKGVKVTIQTTEDRVDGKMAKNKEVPEYNPFLEETYTEEMEKSIKLPDIGPGPSPNSLKLALTTFTAKEKAPIQKWSKEKDKSDAVINISAQIFSFRQALGGAYQNFEVRPDYSGSERWGDEGTGTVSVQKQLSSKVGFIGVVLSGREIVDTRVDLTLEREVSKEVSIPVFFQDDLQNLLQKKNLSGEGGLLFIELDNSTESVNLDAQYESVIYLSKDLRPVNITDDYHYMLFVGTTPGSTTIEYIRNGYENLKKVILIEPGVIYYDFNEYIKVGRDIVDISQRNTLGHYKSDLNIGGGDIVQFNSYEKASQIGPGRYDLSINVIPSGTRKYIELNHLSSPIYLGRWDAKKVVVPSENYIAQFLKAVELDELTGSCLIQVNFKDKAKEFYIEGKNGNNYIPIDRIYIDRDGQFSDTLSPLSVKGFFLSDQVGVISINVQYENGREDFLNSYCASSAYIIEQL